MQTYIHTNTQLCTDERISITLHTAGNVGRQTVVARSNCSRTVIVTMASRSSGVGLCDENCTCSRGGTAPGWWINVKCGQWRSKALRGPGLTVTWRPSLSLPSTSPSLPFPSPFPPLPQPSPSPAAKRPPNPARGSGERCKLPQRGLGWSPNRNRIWCILALKSVIWWQ